MKDFGVKITIFLCILCIIMWFVTLPPSKEKVVSNYKQALNELCTEYKLNNSQITSRLDDSNANTYYYNSIHNSTGQWSEPNTSVWISAETNFSLRSEEARK